MTSHTGPSAQMTAALLHEVFHGPDGADRLRERLVAARDAGADLAVLPELPLDPWVPARREPHDDDAEGADGPRRRQMCLAAADAGLAILGGAIVRDPASGRRYNRALVIDASGALVASYDKLHVPNEEGFWEAEHYDGGQEPPRPVGGFALSLGVQICSDLFRPEGCQLLGAQGVEVILAPRATPEASYERWREIIRANAVTTTAYVLSANRPGPEAGVTIGGASLAVDPQGQVLAETTGPMRLIELRREAVREARKEYPGYLSVRSDLYARAWALVGR